MALPSSTRYNIRYSERKGVTIDVAVTSNLRTFYRLMEATGGRSNFPIRALDYYEKEWHIFSQLGQACLFMARYQDQIIAMQMPFYFGKHAATFHAGSLNKYRELKAGYLIMWQAMCWAREQGCRTFDLWGIPDEVGELITNGKSVPDGRSDGLWGVYYFKQAFRGRVVYYAGAFDYVYSPLSYPLFTSKFFTPERLDRIAVWMDRLKHS
jgi:lipid II:glycine glycyltransferase (peptidoglycan interpeptide bridge formation enzyme)